MVGRSAEECVGQRVSPRYIAGERRVKSRSSHPSSQLPIHNFCSKGVTEYSKKFVLKGNCFLCNYVFLSKDIPDILKLHF